MCCGTVRPSSKMMDKGTGQNMKLKQCDLETAVNCNLTAMFWKYK
jgi:hypothetical protein